MYLANYQSQNSPTHSTSEPFVVGVDYVIQTLGTTSFTLIGAATNTVGTSFQATGVGAGTGTASPIADDNTATGKYALFSNTSGSANVGTGPQALWGNTTGSLNVAVGNSALNNNVTGNYNTGVGAFALLQGGGSSNTAIGYAAGQNLTTGSYNIDIGNVGVAGEANTIRIGAAPNQTRTFIAGINGAFIASGNNVFIDSNGQLGTSPSSGRYKDDIADMDATSSALMKLRPVTFHYKSDRNPAGRALQYGLIAEEVDKIYPGLVAHAADGRIETVMYQFLPPMLLNEFQKQQRTIEAQAARIEALERQAADIAMLKQQLALVQAALPSPGRLEAARLARVR